MTHDPYFGGRYRIPSNRLSTWNYTNVGSYFVTICTDRKRPSFGFVRNGFVCLSDIGSIVADEWTKTLRIRSNITLGAWIIMPDHMHGIITIGDRNNDNGEWMRLGRCDNQNRWRSGSLGSIINQFKSVCTKRIRAIGHSHFAWQPRFHDRIIRNPDEYAHIQYYIFNNPRVWTRKHAD